MIGHFISGQASRRQHVLRQLIQIGLVVIFHRRHLAPGRRLAECGSLLDSQFVQGYMRRAEIQNFFQLHLPLIM